MLNAYTKNVWKLIEGTMYVYACGWERTCESVFFGSFDFLA